MLQINQVIYSIYAVFCLGLAANAYADFRTTRSGSAEQLWFIAILLMFFHNVLLVIAPVTHLFLLTVSHTLTVSSLVTLLYVFRSIGKLKTKYYYVSVLCCSVFFFVFFEYLRSSDNYVYRNYLGTLAIFTIIVAQFITLLRIASKQNPSIHVKILIAITGLIIVMICLRVFYANAIDLSTTKNIYDEVGLNFYSRIFTSILVLLMFFTVSNYFYQSLHKKAVQRLASQETDMLGTLNALALARDNETGNHILRTQHYVRVLAKKIQEYPEFNQAISNEDIEQLFKAAPLHDIGKVGIPDHILLKPGKLDDEEWEVMKTHTLIGEKVLRNQNPEDEFENDVIKKALRIAGSHHERWDGTGYPRGLKGSEIPLEAQIMAIADMYDALVSKRIYKDQWSSLDAITEITKKSGTHFNPQLVQAFIEVANDFEKILEKYKD